MASSTTLTLNTGAKMPVLGLGTWQSKTNEVQDAVEAAIDAGYRHIDCAILYGNEAEVGNAVHKKIQGGVVKRKDLFITSKVWSTYFRNVRDCLAESLRRLQLDCVDLYLMHWPFALQFTSPEDPFPIDENGKCRLDEEIHYLEVWKELEKLQKEGLTKAIGVSNFNEYQIQKIWDKAEIKPSVHQYEMHPYLDQEHMLKFCQEKGIVVTGYSPFGSPDRPWASKDEPKLLEHPDVKKIADKHGKTTAQVILRYLLQRGIVVIPKSANASRIKSNTDIFDFNLSDDERNVMKKMDKKWRMFHLPIFVPHKYYPFKESYTE